MLYPTEVVWQTALLPLRSHRRGRSWNDVAAYCRSAFRSPDDAEDGHDDLGFRVVLLYSGVFATLSITM